MAYTLFMAVFLIQAAVFVQTAIIPQAEALVDYEPVLQEFLVSESQEVTLDKPESKDFHGQIIEGDILGVNNVEDQLSRTGIIQNRWPVSIPYYIDSAFTQTEKDIIIRAMGEYVKVAHVMFVPWKSGDTSYIYVKKGGAGTGCNAYVGKYSGGQNVNLEVSSYSNCVHFKTVLHELMHAVGFWHEQSREDRDSYVEINKDNIPKNLLFNFDKRPAGTTTTFGLPYDIYSLMHYGRYAFAINRNVWTIRPLGANSAITHIGSDSSYTGFSDTDVRRLKAMYPHCSRGYMGANQQNSFWTFVKGHNLPNVDYTTMRSAQVESGCTMKICTASNFGGSCKSMTAGKFDFATMGGGFDQNVRSLSCSC